ncbi:MAG: RHS repeat-associated core domain-containing protein [Methylococcaceae bacterium]|nr:RHS repeat-associated core domain-containing protein [Methylococcaceae bacterium]MDP3932649.1 RHS repeat-associated core domain-containing protein [Methylococcaceae bacterium]
MARITGSVASPSATAAYYHQDGLGSVLATTNAAKVVTATQRFDAFGTKLAGTGSIPQYGYTGREPDQSGLNYYRARYYDPNGGRFTARDPMGYADGINRYAYVGNNPINFNDPNGLFANKAATWADTQSTNYVSARTELYSNIGNGIGNAYNSGLSQLPSSISNPIQGFVSGAQGQVSSNPSVANFLGNNLRGGFTNILDSVAPTIPGTDVRFAFGLGVTKGGGTVRNAIAGEYQYTRTAGNHINDIVTKGEFKGELARPYLNSPNTISEIINSDRGVTDPGGVAGALRYDVPGTFRNTQGTEINGVRLH